MIKKDTLLKQLGKLISMEEAITLSMRDQLSAAFSFSGADKDKKEDFQQRLQQVAEREQKHIDMLKELKSDISEKTITTY